MKNLIKIIAISLCLVIVFSLCSCEIAKGTDGKDGLSAYELAVKNGFEGTLEEWLESLKGEKGNPGNDGYNGENGKDGKDGQDGLSTPANLDSELMARYVVVTEHGVQPNTGKDVASAINKIITDNPNKTIYFPDGQYLVSSPIRTSADPTKSVSLLLSNYAEIKATSAWTNNLSNAVIMLGDLNASSDVETPGSNYFLEGGIINGNKKANGVSIVSGRETRVEGVSIKNAIRGLHIKSRTDGSSADADIINVNITGANTSSSIGVLIEGSGNTLENMRITRAKIGVKLTAGGNVLRDIHPLIGNMNLYSGSIGFFNVSGANWFDLCYADNFETAFKISNTETSSFINCYSYWWYKNSEHIGGYQITKKVGFEFVSKFNSIIQNSRINFSNADQTNNAYLVVGADGGTGSILNPIIDEHNDNNTYKNYLVGNN